MPWNLKFWNSNPTPPASAVTWDYGSGIAPSDVPVSQAADITNYLNSIAGLSTLAMSRLNAYGQDIRIGYQLGNAGQAFRGPIDDYILIDLTAAEKVYFFNTKGTLMAADVRLTLMHELAHNYLPGNDPNMGGEPTETQMNAANFDFRGPVVNEQNAIATSAQLADQIQTSYFAALSSDEALFAEFSTDVSYSDGNTVDTTRWGTGGANTIDHSSNTTRLNDLLFGLGGDDTIKSGKGDDYVYAGDGKDKVWGGEGNDFLSGNAGDDEFYGEKGNDEIWGRDRNANLGAQDGLDKVDYSAAQAKITILIEGGDDPKLIVSDGESGTDTLHSIEIIQGSTHADTLIVSTLTSQTSGALDYVDLGESSADTIDISALNGSVTVDLRDPQSQTVTFGDAVLKIRNVENVTGAGADDHVLLGTSVSSNITGGGGDDTFSIAGGSHMLAGGDGEDVLDLSATVTGSRISMDVGLALVRGSGASTFSSIERIVGCDQTDLMFGAGQGTRMIGGGGNNYLEGSGADVLESTDGDTYFSLTGGGTIISGVGNDYIELSGTQPATVKFGVGSGHDVLAIHDFHARVYDTIDFVGLMPSDIELVWNYTDEPLGFDNVSYRTGEAAIRMVNTGETLHLGEIAMFHNGIDIYGGEGGISWNGIDQWTDGDENPVFKVEYDAFKFADGGKYNFYELFDFINTPFTALPAEATAARDLLSRLGSGGAGAVLGGSNDPDTLTGTNIGEDILAGGGDDAVDGGGGNDFIRGGEGQDVLEGGGGDDLLHGGGGWDIASYTFADAAVSVDLGLASAQDTGAAGSDTLVDIEGVSGSSYNDMLRGNSANNDITGGDGDDTIIGGDGLDWLIGGAGADTFRDTSSGLDGDTIVDFDLDDRLVISDADPESFSFSLDWTTLTYTGGSLAFGSAPAGRLVVSAAAGGGVQIALEEAIRNDFNGDGRSDVIWRSDSGSFTEWLGQSNGGFVGNDANAAQFVPTSWHVQSPDILLV